MNSIKNINYLNDESKKYVSIDMLEDNKILDYQVEMVNNNQGNGILYIDKRQLNEDIQFLYDTTNFISFKEYIADSEVDGNNLFSILNNLVNVILSLPGFLLHVNNIIFDEDYILVDRVKKTVGLIYVPCEENIQNTELEFKQLIKQVIIDYMNEKSNMKYFVNELLPIVNSKDYSLNAINKSLSTVKTKAVTRKIETTNLEKKEEVIVQKPAEPRKNEGFFSSLFKHMDNKKNLNPKAKEYILNFNIDGANEVVKIDKDEFILGRLKTSVDYCIKSNVVGKVHAKIIKNKSNLYIIDLTSKNGTYVNGIKLKSDETHILNDGDEIKLGNIQGKLKIQ